VIYTVGSGTAVINNARVYNNSFAGLNNARLIFLANGGVSNLLYNNIFHDLPASPDIGMPHDYSWFSSPDGIFGEMHAQSGGSPFVDPSEGRFPV